MIGVIAVAGISIDPIILTPTPVPVTERAIVKAVRQPALSGNQDSSDKDY